MQRQTETIEIGSNAPRFTLLAANRDGQFLMEDLIARGPLILEFLRGTW